MRRIALLVPLALALSGCVAVAPGGADVASASTDRGVDALDVVAESCWMAGGVFQNVIPPGMDIGVPEPFEPQDNLEYKGLPVEDGQGWTIGNAHVAVECESWVVNGQPSHHPNLGWVGLVVKAPPFASVEPAERNFLISNIATLNPALGEAVRATGFHVYEGSSRGGVFEFQGRHAAVGVIETAGDGTYATELDVLSETAPWTLLRFWLIVPDEEGALHPAFIDMRLDGGRTWFGEGFFSHMHTGKHGPIGRADGETGGLAVQNFGFTMNLTVLPDVVHEMWNH